MEDDVDHDSLGNPLASDAVESFPEDEEPEQAVNNSSSSHSGREWPKPPQMGVIQPMKASLRLSCDQHPFNIHTLWWEMLTFQWH